MTTTAYHLTHAAEIYGPATSLDNAGPTGEWAEVTAGEVRDYGGNVLFSGTADECVRERAEWRIPTRLVPTAWEKFAGDVCGCDHEWQLVIA